MNEIGVIPTPGSAFGHVILTDDAHESAVAVCELAAAIAQSYDLYEGEQSAFASPHVGQAGKTAEHIALRAVEKLEAMGLEGYTQSDAI